MPDLDLLPITGLTFDGTSLMRDDGLFLRIKRGVGEVPAVRGDDTVVPGRRGRIPRARVADHLSIELEGYVGGIAGEGDDPTETQAYYALVDELVALFDPEADPAVLEYVHPDGTTRSINARVQPPLLWNETIEGHVAELNVALESVDPDWAIEGP